MFGGGSATRWTQAQLISMARRNVMDAIGHGNGDGAKEKTRELLRLCLQGEDEHDEDEP